MNKVFKYNFTSEHKEGFTNITAKDVYDKKNGFGWLGGVCADERGAYQSKDGVPIEFKSYTGKNGTYNVKVTVTAVEENAKVSVLSQSRRFMCIDTPVAFGNEYSLKYSVCVCDVHMHGCDRQVWDSVNTMIMGNGIRLCSIEIEEKDMPVMYIAGDSTVTDQPAQYPYNPSSTFCGWGQMIGAFLKPGIAVSNHAQSGSTTEEFKSCNWNVIKERIKPGDMLFMEFGHNDQKIDTLDAFGGYRRNLIYYINEAKARGAYPVICSSINRIIFNPDGTLADLLGDYGRACEETAKEFGVPFVNMLGRTTEYFEAAGCVKAWDYFWGDGENRDYTHTNDTGGRLIAKMAANEIMQKNIIPAAAFIKEEEITYTIPDWEKSPVTDSSKELEHLAGIGLVNVPKGSAIPDIDKDIRNI